MFKYINDALIEGLEKNNEVLHEHSKCTYGELIFEIVEVKLQSRFVNI